MNTINLTHYDLDGIVSGILLSKIYSILNLYTGYSKLDKHIDKAISYLNEDDKLIISDLCLNKSQFDKIKNYQYQIFDHHKESEYLKKYSSTIIDTSKSATKIIYDYFNMKRTNSNIDNLVELTNIYDLWQEENERFDEAYNLNKLFYAMPFEQFYKKIKNGFFGFDNECKYFLNLYDLHFKSFLENLKRQNKIKQINNTLIISNIGNNAEYINEIYLNYRNQINYLIYFVIDPNDFHNVKISYRNPQRNKMFNQYIDDLKEILGSSFSLYVKSFGGHDFVGGLTIEIIDFEDLNQFLIPLI